MFAASGLGAVRERREMTSKYDTSVDLSNKNNSHTLISELVGQGKRVLDVGASTGFLAQTLRSHGCAVTGIEIDPEAARQAEEFCDRVIVGDVEELDLEAELGREIFDVVVFGDVLEHLRDPLGTLERFKPLLKSDGYVVASVPNVAHGSVRLALLQGKFRYRSLGLLDDTHLRFFTRASLEELFEDAGFFVSEMRRTWQDVFATEVEVDKGSVPENVVRMVRSDPEASTYQFVLKARAVDGPGMPETLVYDLTSKPRDVQDLQRLLNVRNAQVAEREREVARLTQEVSSLSDRLARLVQQGKADAEMLMVADAVADAGPAEAPTHEEDPGADAAGRSAPPVPAASAAAYDDLAAYGLARTYAGGKSVADVGWDAVGRGSLVLAETAGEVVGLAVSDAAVERALADHPAPNVTYRRAELPGLPAPDDRFDVVVAFGVLEKVAAPEEFLQEARRTLKRNGVLLISVPDRLYARQGMYAVEVRELLERHFGAVRLYRHGAVAGGLIFPESGEPGDVRVESARLSPTAPAFDPAPPETRSLLAVCGEAGTLGGERPYLVLDRDRRVFDECEDRAEEAELVRDEIRRIQETEAQAFRDALQLHRSEISFLRARVRRSESLTARGSHAQKRIKDLSDRVEGMENSVAWRFFAPYRWLRDRTAAWGRKAGGEKNR